MDHKPHLLLIEDHHIALNIIEQISVYAGCDYTSAHNAELAFDLIQTHKFDLIITDLGLPGMSGTELTKKIRAWEKLNQLAPIPIIGLTAHSQKNIKEQCINSGMQNSFSKPMNIKTLKDIVVQYVINHNS